MGMRMFMKPAAVFVALALAMSSCALPAAAFPFATSDAPVSSAIAYLKSAQQADGGFGDSASSCYADLTPFAVMAAVAAGEDPHSWKVAGGTRSAVDFLKDVSVPCLNGLSIPTNYATVMLALAAAGDSPQNVSGMSADTGGTVPVLSNRSFNVTITNARNLTAELLSMQNLDGSFNTNAWITDQEWAVLALAASGCNMTSELNASVDYLLSKQRADGGFGAWCPDAASSCPDETSLGVMALVAAGHPSGSNNVTAAMARIKTFETADAGIDPGWGMGANVDSDAWAVQAIVASGNNFTGWENASNLYVFDHMAGLQAADGSFNYSVTFQHFKIVQDTGYAVAALLGRPFPVCNGCAHGQAAGTERNQTFSVSFAQNESWDVTLSHASMTLAAESANVTLYVRPPSGSAGKADNITVNVTSSSGESRYASIVLSAEAACGNGACESGESCSSCASDCGACPAPAAAASSGSGGSSGGAASAAVSADKKWGVLGASGIGESLTQGSKATFTIGGAEHSITLKSLNSTAASIELRSDAVQLTLGIGDTRKADLDADGRYDVSVRLESISGLTARFRLSASDERYACPACPQAGEWSACKGGTRKRTAYACDGSTSYECAAVESAEACVEGVPAAGSEQGLPTGLASYIGTGSLPFVAAAALAIAAVAVAAYVLRRRAR